jgi:hypothetical protein
VTVYLAGPNTQQQAEHAADMPVLLSYAYYAPWLDRYQHTFRRVLIDSGAYSELNGGKRADVAAYAGWAARWLGHADAVAGLDDIGGDWRRSLANYEAFPRGFPTFHDSDPPELLPDLIAMARERGGWLGVGLVPPRDGKEGWLRAALARVPADVHVHGWALRAYAHVRRLDSMDSTNWWRDAMALRSRSGLEHLTYGECLEIVVKRYQRERRLIRDEPAGLFDAPPA